MSNNDVERAAETILRYIRKHGESSPSMLRKCLWSDRQHLCDAAITHLIAANKIIEISFDRHGKTAVRYWPGELR